MEKKNERNKKRTNAKNSAKRYNAVTAYANYHWLKAVSCSLENLREVQRAS